MAASNQCSIASGLGVVSTASDSIGSKAQSAGSGSRSTSPNRSKAARGVTAPWVHARRPGRSGTASSEPCLHVAHRRRQGGVAFGDPLLLERHQGGEIAQPGADPAGGHLPLGRWWRGPRRAWRRPGGFRPARRSSRRRTAAAKPATGASPSLSPIEWPAPSGAKNPLRLAIRCVIAP